MQPDKPLYIESSRLHDMGVTSYVQLEKVVNDGGIVSQHVYTDYDMDFKRFRFWLHP